MEKCLHTAAALAVLILAVAGVQFVKGETFYIVTTPDSPFCPNGSAGSGDGDGQQCLTLPRFVARFISNQLNPANLTLELEPGEHILNSNLTMTTVVSFAMISEAATINCTSPDFRYLYLYSLRDVLISGVTFMDCGEIGVFSADRFRFENSSFQVIEHDYPSSLVLESVVDVAVIGSTFTRNRHNDVLYVGNGTSILHVQNCVFSHMKTLGRAIYSVNSMTVIIDSSTFEEVASDLQHDGTVVEIVSNKENVTLKNCEFINNTIGNGSHALVSVDGLGSIVVHNNRFTQNTGRVLHILSSANETIIDHNNFVDNTGPGAALDINAKSVSLNISGNNFTRNTDGAVKLLVSDSTVTVSDCSFFSNSKSENGGAAMTVYEHDDVYPENGNFNYILLSQSSFFNNSVNINGSGGALHIRVDSPWGYMLINTSIFSHNHAQQAGAVYINFPVNYTFGVYYTMFEGNVATEGHAGAVAIEGEAEHSVLIINSTFANNSAPHSSAGAVYITASTVVMGSMFSNNLAQNCGALALTSGDIQMFDSTFLLNEAAASGGAICTYSVNNVSFSNGNFSYNRAEESGGVLITESLANGEYWNKSTLFLIQGSSYFDNNVAGSQGGVFATFTQSEFLIGPSAFFNNLAGIEGGVMYVRDTNSSVGLLSDFYSQFSYNRAAKRGGVISINGSTLTIGDSLIFNNNSADMGPVISACNTKVYFTPDILYQYNDPIFSNCLLYDVAEHRPTTAATTPTIPPTRAKDSNNIAIAVTVPIVCLLGLAFFVAVILALVYWRKYKKPISVGRYGVKKSESDDPDLAPLMDNA